MHIKTRSFIAVATLLLTSQLSFAQSTKNNTAAYMNTADQMIKKGNFKEAALAIDKLVAEGTIMPPEMLYQYARIYAETGEKSKSVKLLNEAIDKGWWSINQIKEDKDLNKALVSIETEKVLSKMRSVSAPYLIGKAVLSGGGNGEISTFLYHYLFKPDDKRFETLLIKKCKGEADWHRSEPPVERMAGGPNLGDKPIYVFTSGNTFSAAEYFAFMMKELRLATIIGKNTGGGGNPVSLTGDGRYVMYVPICQITTEAGKSLEGKGVAPDIEFVSDDWEKEMMEVVNANLK